MKSNHVMKRSTQELGSGMGEKSVSLKPPPPAQALRSI